MSSNELVSQIEELQLEVINQYIINFHNIARYLKWMRTVTLLSHFELNIDEQTMNSMFTLREQKKIKNLLQNNNDTNAFKELFNKKKFINLLTYCFSNVVTDTDREKGLEVQETFNQVKFDEIYDFMLNDADNKEYLFLSELCGFKVDTLIVLLNEIKSLKSKVGFQKDLIINAELQKIFNEYVRLDFLTCGFNDDSLKKRIKSAKSIQRDYCDLMEEKIELLFSTILNIQARIEEKNKKIEDEKYRVSSKWNNPSQAIKKNIEEIKQAFNDFDTRWIEENIKYYENELILLNEDLNSSKQKKENNIYIVNELKNILSKGYPFEEIKNQLPYSTNELEEVLIKRLRTESEFLKKILVPE